MNTRTMRPLKPAVDVAALMSTDDHYETPEGRAVSLGERAVLIANLAPHPAYTLDQVRRIACWHEHGQVEV